LIEQRGVEIHGQGTHQWQGVVIKWRGLSGSHSVTLYCSINNELCTAD